MPTTTSSRLSFVAAATLFAFAALPATAAERVVSVGGSITEIVYALGEADRLVAVDSTSLYPEAATELPDVGYLRQLSAEPILSLEPTLVLAEPDAGPPAALDQLRAAEVELVVVSDDTSPTGVGNKIAAVAAALDVPEAGRALSNRVAGEFAALARDREALSARPTVLFLLAVGNGAPLAGGAGTSSQAVIALAGGVNAVKGFTGYKPLSPEAIVGAAPDFILVTERTLDLLGGRDGLRALPGIAATPAGQAEDGIVAMDGLKLLGFGPRTPEAARELMDTLHPAAPQRSAAE